MNLQSRTFTAVTPRREALSDKVTIVGAGMVGTSCAVVICNLELTRHLTLVDPFGDKVNGEILDLQHAALFTDDARIEGGNDYECTKDSKILVITCGARTKPGESRLSLTQRNAEIMIKLIPELIKLSPDAIILMVTNPVDILSYVAWKTTGLPKSRVIGSGTELDSARFRVRLASRFKMSPDNVDAWVIGEHGDSSVAVWSSVNLAGTRIKLDETWQEVHQETVRAGNQIIRLKGHTNWGVAGAVANIVRAILTNSLNIHSVSVNVKGKYGLEDDVYVSMPAVIGIDGVTDIVDLRLSESEREAFVSSARMMKGIQDGINFGAQATKCRCTRCRKLKKPAAV